MINTIKAIEIANQQATCPTPLNQSDIDTLNAFNGFGSLAKAFECDSQNQKLRDAFLSGDDFNSAHNSTLTSFFTPEKVIKSIYSYLDLVGIRQQCKVLEPALGSGRFIDYAPANFRGNFTGVELDRTTGLIARLKHKSERIYINQRFENVEFDEPFSLCVTNPPYGDMKAHDLRYGRRLSVHNYFALRAIDELHDSGVLVMVVSTWLMDSQTNITRKLLSQKAKLLAAVRLPNTVFSSEGVSLPVDIIVMQKGSGSESPNWIDSEPLINPTGKINVNRHYIENPECILGDINSPNIPTHTCQVNGDADDAINSIVPALLSQCDEIHLEIPSTDNVAADQDLLVELPQSELSLFEIGYIDGALYRRISDSINLDGDVIKNHKELNIPRAKEERLIAYLAIKDTLKALVKAEQDDIPESHIEALRQTLNYHHTKFIDKFGPLQRSHNKSALGECSFYNRTKAIESDYQKADKSESIEESYKLAPIMNKRVFRPYEAPKSASNPIQALSISISEYASVNLSRISKLLKKTVDETQELLLDNELVFKNPQTGEFEVAAQYLSGNILEKINQCPSTTEYVRNLAALNRVMPTALTADKISVSIGTSWIPAKYYEEFVLHLMGDKAKPKVLYTAGGWIVQIDGWGFHTKSAVEYGTERRDFESLFTSALNTSKVVVTDTVNDKQVVNEQETAHANQKLELIASEFEDFIFADVQRRTHLEKLYNQQFNTYVAPDYSSLGEHLQFVGSALTPRSFQKTLVARGLLTDNMLADSAVGSGKSWVFATLALMAKQVNKSTRSLIVMPNSLVTQFHDSFLATYPHANLICLDNSLDARQRQERLMTALTSDFDLLIVAASTFKSIEAPRDIQVELMEEQLQELEQYISDADEKEINTRRLLKMKDKVSNQLNELVNTPMLPGITFSDLKISQLMVDECQEYKSLFYNTAMTGVRGMNSPTGSKAAFDLFVKTRAVQSIGGKVIFGTGTTISNSCIEAVTWIRYLCPSLKHLHNTDSFIKTFATPLTKLELSPTGRSFKAYTTISRFTNMPELQRIYRQFAEVVTEDQLVELLPPLADGRPAIPQLKGGKVKSVVLDISPDQDTIFNQLVEDAKNISQKNNMLKIMNTARAASLDARFVNPFAVNKNNVVSAAITEIKRLHNQSKHFKGNVLVFCDRGVSNRHRAASIKEINELFRKAEAGDSFAIQQTKGLSKSEAIAELSSAYSIYDELETELKKDGINVAVVQDFKTPAAKAKLKRDFNSGKVNVLIGSSFSMGAGWNLNERLVAALHLDMPLRSSDWTQRNGRILRQGNKAYESGYINEVEVMNFSTTKTLDSWFMALLERKQNFVRQFQNGVNTDVRVYEPEEETIDFGSLSAILADDPLMLERVKLQHNYKKLSLLKSAHRRTTFALQNDLNQYNRRFFKLANELKLYKADKGVTTNLESFVLPCGTPINGKGLESRVSHILSNYQLRSADKYHLLASNDDLRLEGNFSGGLPSYRIAGNASYEVFMSNPWGRGNSILNAAAKTLAKISSTYDSAYAAMTRLTELVNETDMQLKKPFKYDAELSQTKQRLQQVELLLVEQQEQKEQQQAA